MSVLVAILLTIFVSVNCQRSPYAGSRPSSGYKDGYLDRPLSSSTQGQNIDLGNRVGESSTSSSVGATTNHLPVEAYGDKFIVDHYNNLPVEQRPFWILNQDHIDLHRGSTQQQLANNGGNAENSGLNNIQSTTNSVPSGATSATLGERFGANNNYNPYQQLPTVGNYQPVVYPANSSPIQRVDLEIQYLQNRLDSLQRQRQQLSQQQLTTQNSQSNQQGQQILQQQRFQRSPYHQSF